MSDLTLPRKHLNGGNWRRLTQQYKNAYDAVRVAINALADVDFHARDYYIIDDQAASKAAATRDRQFIDLARIRDELQAHIENGLTQDPKALD